MFSWLQKLVYIFDTRILIWRRTPFLGLISIQHYSQERRNEVNGLVPNHCRIRFINLEAWFTSHLPFISDALHNYVLASTILASAVGKHHFSSAHQCREWWSKILHLSRDFAFIFTEHLRKIIGARIGIFEGNLHKALSIMCFGEYLFCNANYNGWRTLPATI